MLFFHNKSSISVSEFLMQGREYTQEERKLPSSHFTNFQKDTEDRIKNVWWAVACKSDTHSLTHALLIKKSLMFTRKVDNPNKISSYGLYKPHCSRKK